MVVNASRWGKKKSRTDAAWGKSHAPNEYLKLGRPSYGMLSSCDVTLLNLRSKVRFPTGQSKFDGCSRNPKTPMSLNLLKCTLKKMAKVNMLSNNAVVVKLISRCLHVTLQILIPLNKKTKKWRKRRWGGTRCSSNSPSKLSQIYVISFLTICIFSRQPLTVKLQGCFPTK